MHVFVERTQRPELRSCGRRRSCNACRSRHGAMLSACECAFEKAGVEFIPENGGGLWGAPQAALTSNLLASAAVPTGLRNS